MCRRINHFVMWTIAFYVIITSTSSSCPPGAPERRPLSGLKTSLYWKSRKSKTHCFKTDRAAKDQPNHSNYFEFQIGMDPNTVGLTLCSWHIQVTVARIVTEDNIFCCAQVSLYFSFQGTHSGLLHAEGDHHHPPISDEAASLHSSQCHFPIDKRKKVYLND